MQRIADSFMPLVKNSANIVDYQPCCSMFLQVLFFCAF